MLPITTKNVSFSDSNLSWSIDLTNSCSMARLDSQRRTRYFSQNSCPIWKQTMVYPDIKLEDLKKKYLEISVWSFNIYHAHVFLGQVIVHLSGKWPVKVAAKHQEFNNFYNSWKFCTLAIHKSFRLPDTFSFTRAGNRKSTQVQLLLLRAALFKTRLGQEAEEL